MKRLICVLMAALLACSALPAAWAEDVKIIDASAARGTVDVAESYICVTCPGQGDTEVIVTVYDAKGAMCYQRNYGACSGAFRSEDIYLRLKGSSTEYQVMVMAGSQVYSFNVKRTMPYLTDNLACSVGYPMSAITGQKTWKTVTLLDLVELEEGEETVALYASGAYEIGTVTFSVSDNQLKTTARLSSGVKGSIDGGKVYVARNAVEARDLDSKRFAGVKGRLNKAIDLRGATYAVVYVELTVSFDPSGAGTNPEAELRKQKELWDRIQEATANDAVG